MNAWMVDKGWAFACRKYSRDYVGEETAARAAKRGVWQGDVLAPWDWRRGERLVVEGTAVSPAPSQPTAQQGGGRCAIKGNISKGGMRIDHVPSGRFYDRTRIDASKGERWFCTEAEAHVKPDSRLRPVVSCPDETVDLHAGMHLGDAEFRLQVIVPDGDSDRSPHVPSAVITGSGRRGSVGHDLGLNFCLSTTYFHGAADPSRATQEYSIMAEKCRASNGDVWEIYKDRADEWRWRRTASNGRNVGSSNEGYANKSDCIANAERHGMDCTPS